MDEVYDWAGFYRALCEHGPHLLLGIDGGDGANGGLFDMIASVAVDTDAFWSEGLQSVLADAATEGDLEAGVLSALDIWRENVVAELSDDFGVALDWNAVTIDAESPLIEELVEAAAPDDP
jgi:hypothetical protein